MNQATSLELPLADEVLASIVVGISSEHLGDARRHVGQCGTGRETLIPDKGEVQLTK